MLLLCRFAILVVLVTTVVVAEDSATCARMDVPVLQRIAQGLCTTSCTAQKCATGSCKKVDSHPTCFCSNCSPGSNEEVALDKLLSKHISHK